MIVLDNTTLEGYQCHFNNLLANQQVYFSFELKLKVSIYTEKPDTLCKNIAETVDIGQERLSDLLFVFSYSP